jgi:uncharacterized protein (DUF4415 family)
MSTDFAKLDATSEDEIGRHMAEDGIPDLSDAILEAERGRTVWRGRRGRPRSEHAKVPINIRLSRDVLEAFKASGPVVCLLDSFRRFAREDVAGGTLGPHPFCSRTALRIELLLVLLRHAFLDEGRPHEAPPSTSELRPPGRWR